jgi:DNA-binding PadR family transcriptional regulator
MAVKRNKSRYAILGILLLGPRSGYDIKKFFERTVANFWSESYGQIYPILKRLTAEGRVEKSIQKQAGKPDRHIYTITAEGRSEMREWLLTPVGRQVGRHEILLKLIFGCRQEVADNIRQVEHFRKMQREDLDQTNQLMEMVAKDYGNDPAMPFLKIALRYGHHVNRAYLQWADEAISELKALQAHQARDGID